MMYFINDQFCLDDGTPMGINVQLYSIENDTGYWDSEERFDNMADALEFVKGMKRKEGYKFDIIDPLNYLPTNKQIVTNRES